MRTGLLIIPLSVSLITSCQVEASKAKVDQLDVRQAQMSAVRAEELCARLNELKEIPFRPQDFGDDEIYIGLVRSKETAIPCLINKLTDEESMKDPRQAPVFRGFRVGDAAFFMLIRLTNAPFEEILPEEVMANWKEEGVYAYFRYVQDSNNRRLLQARWSNWLQEQEAAEKP